LASALTKANDYDEAYFDEDPAETKTGNDGDCSHDNDSEEEMPDDSDDSDDGGYNGYGGYDEYGGLDRSYYYRDGRYERKVSPMMNRWQSCATLGRSIT